MKVLLASTSSGSRGGGEIFLLYLAEQLKSAGHEPVLWCSDNSRMNELAEAFAPFGKIIRAEYVNTYDLAGRSFAAAANSGKAKTVATEWKRLNPDIVHVNKQNLEDGLELVEAARLSGLPAVGTIHLTQSMTELKAVVGPARDYISRKTLKRWPGAWVAVSEERGRKLEEFLGDKKNVRVIENGVPVPSTAQLEKWRREKRAKLKLEPDQKLVVAVGRLVKQKRPELFLETAKKWSALDRRARFLWIGDGNLKEQWDDWVSENKFGEVVRQEGWQKSAADYLAAADHYLHLAEFEGLPLALLEAMATGLPCGVSANLVKELPFLKETNCWRVETKGPLGLPAANVAVELGREARALVEKKFSAAHMTQQYLTLYQEAIGAKK